MPDMRHAAIAANRFGFGARPGELAAIANDPRGWAKSQLATPYAPPPAIAALPAAEDDLLAFGRWYAHQRLNGPNGARVAQRLRRQGATDTQVAMASIEENFIQNFRPRIQASVDARLQAALTTDRPVAERCVHFWSNHFTVSTAKPAAVAMPPSFEKDAIRPHIQGRFVDMLLASTKHPGMLIYLDNWLSIGPNSPAARQPNLARRMLPQGARANGINENLGREILELHTLGVGGGYAQADVQSLAAIITGWSYDRPNGLEYLTDGEGTRSGGDLFRFFDIAHEPGAKTLCGRRYAQEDVAQGEAALADLARHPSTAHHLATKLARQYIADDPPAAAVARIAAAYSTSDGDLRHTMEAVIDCPEAWEQPFVKFKQPEEYAISVLRAANVHDLPIGAGLAVLTTLGQRPYSAPGPDGWPDAAANWLSPDLIWKRLEFAQSYAQRIGRADVDPVTLGQAVQGPLLSDETIQTVRRAESPIQGFALLFGAPEFQRR